MKHNTSLLLFLFLVFSAFSQERQLMEGEVVSGNIQLENVHVKNITTKNYTLTNADGRFRINSRAGDTLVLSHVGMQDLIHFISEANMSAETLRLQMQPVSSELDEVIVKSEHDINAVSLGIIPKKTRKIPQQERKLKAATDSEFSLTSVTLDPILNLISGRTKKLKKNVAVEKKIANFDFVKNNYLSYLQEEVGIPEAQIPPFIDYLVEETSVEAVINSKNQDQMHFFLQDQWIKYQDLGFNKVEEK